MGTSCLFDPFRYVVGFTGSSREHGAIVCLCSHSWFNDGWVGSFDERGMGCVLRSPTLGGNTWISDSCGECFGSYNADVVCLDV